MMNLDSIFSKIVSIFKEIDDVWLYYTLRKYKVKRCQRSYGLIKACIAADKVGFTITTHLISAITGNPYENLSQRLHSLGDKHILVMKRRLGRKSYEWLLHPAFKQMLKKRGN